MRFAWARTAGVAAGLALALAACGRSEGGDADLKARAEAAAFFMRSNARAEGVQTTPSGLQYKVVQSGPPGSPSPDGNDLVSVDYEGALSDGTVFDSSFGRGAPYVTTPEQVVPGWTEALQRMRVGDEWILYVPPELGYGVEGGPPKIPPNAVLVFRVKLLDMAPAPGGGRGVGIARG
jgi:peptidylprolyl isomerase/FKBP-type peptidyl-prolyl cis-trans isomerase FklB